MRDRASSEFSMLTTVGSLGLGPAAWHRTAGISLRAAEPGRRRPLDSDTVERGRVKLGVCRAKVCLLLVLVNFVRARFAS